jgi:outer membrane murein-binding lipoprotein Lpp
VVKRKLLITVAAGVAAIFAIAGCSSSHASSAAPDARSYWYQLGQDIGTSAYDTPASSINTSNTGGNADAPITASGWCDDLVYNPQPQEVRQYTNKVAKGLSKTNTVAAQESRWLYAGCESQFNGWAG